MKGIVYYELTRLLERLRTKDSKEPAPLPLVRPSVVLLARALSDAADASSGHLRTTLAASSR